MQTEIINSKKFKEDQNEEKSAKEKKLEQITEEMRILEEIKFREETKDLNLLVSRVKGDPDGFNEEMIKLIKSYLEAYSKFKRIPSKRNSDLARLGVFLCQVFEFYKEDLKFMIESLSSILETYGNQMHFLNRHKALQSLIILSKKKFWKTEEAIKFYTKLLLLEDKGMRELISKHIVYLIRKNDQSGKNSSIHRNLTGFFAKTIETGEDDLVRRVVKILIALYNKNIWRDKKTINIIGNATLAKDQKTVKLACQFFIATTELDDEDLDSSESESSEDDYMSNFYKMKHIKKTKARQKKIDRDKRKHVRKVKRREALVVKNYSFPIDYIYTPQGFVDSLFKKLKKTKFKFSVKSVMMQLISRLIGRHRLILPTYYSYLQKYLKYGNKEVGKIFAYLAEATHANVPQTFLEPLLKYIILHFANDSCPEVKISLGLNCITQMCARKPLLMSEDDLAFLCELSKYREKNVNRAIKCLINLYRDLNIEMLPKQYRGRRDQDQSMLGKRGFLNGQIDIQSRIEGAELLEEDGNGIVETERFLTNEDFKKIKKLKRKNIYMRELQKFNSITTGEKAAVEPEFDLLANRDKLKAMTLGIEEVDLKEVKPMTDRIETEGLKEWEEDIEGFIEYESSDDEPEDLTRPYDINHGFLDGGDMLYFAPGKQKRLETAKLEAKHKMREKRLGDKIKERGDLTNDRKAKHKPFMMVVDKLKHRAVDLYERHRKTKDKLGKVSKRLKNRVQNKKNKGVKNKGRR